MSTARKANLVPVLDTDFEVIEAVEGELEQLLQLHTLLLYLAQVLLEQLHRLLPIRPVPIRVLQLGPDRAQLGAFRPRREGLLEALHAGNQVRQGELDA